MQFWHNILYNNHAILLLTIKRLENVVTKLNHNIFLTACPVTFYSLLFGYDIKTYHYENSRGHQCYGLLQQ